MKTEIITNEIEQAAEIIRNGGLVAVPTETVYGLAGNGLNEQAVSEIYRVKGRPEVKPLSLMVHDSSAMDAYCEDVPAGAYALAKKFCVSEGAIRHILVGYKQPSLIMTVDIARMMGCSVDELVTNLEEG